jgi:hypothetical protein
MFDLWVVLRESQDRRLELTNYRPPVTTMDGDTWKSCGATGYIVNDAGVMVGLKTTLVLYAKGSDTRERVGHGQVH